MPPPKSEVELLLVDPDEEFVWSITPSLERRGMHVTALGDARRALEWARERRWDVAVVEATMPGMDGLTLMERLHVEDPMLEFVILSANAKVASASREPEALAFDYVSKPCSVDDLVMVILSALRRRREREAEARDAGADGIASETMD